jgi:capsular exopolysaccharide synthesis family protein
VRGGAGGGTKVIQRAEPSATPVGPATRRITELAGLIGVLLGIGAVLLAENSDRRLRTPEDLERLTNWPLLGVIPSSAFAADHQKPRDHEAIQMLSTSLTYFNVDRPLKSVAVVSPALGDGKTTVAVGLAIASARAGRRAVLVDADLRRSQVAVRMDIDVADGLGAVLAGERRPQDVLMVQQDPDSAEGGNLWVLPAGQPPPNPTKLLESSRMAQLLRWLESNSNLVIVDTAAALAVSDTLPLLKQVSGVVLVVRMNQTSAAVVNRMKKVIEAAHGTVLGVVATDIDPSSTSYQEYYRAGRQKRSRPRNWGRRRRRRRFVRSRNGLASDVEVGATLAPNAEAVRAATVEIRGAASENGDDLAPEPPAVLASRPDS